MQIAIRTDASNLIGSGHVMRCLTLAKGLRAQGHEILFVCRNHPGNMNHQISKAGFDVAVLEQPADPITSSDPNDYAAWLSVPQQIDADATIAALKFHPDWMIIDHYGIDRVWETIVRPAVGGIMAIDDLANRRHDCDLLLDQNYSAEPYRRYQDLVPAGCRRMLGPEFALVRDEFRAVRQQRTAEPNVLRVNVFFGGVDATGETVKLLDAVIHSGLEDCRFDVIIGTANARRNRILKLASRHGSVSVHENVNNMASLFARASVAIGAGGTTVWERCCVGLPSVLVSIADNQTAISEEVAAAGAAIYLGRSNETSGPQMITALKTLIADDSARKRMGQIAMDMTDGTGCSRVIMALAEKVEGVVA